VMTDRVQQNVFGETAEQDYKFEVEGRTIRPWKQLIDCVLTGGTSAEYKPHLTESGWVVDAVDSANVIMVNTELFADAFETHNSGDTEEIGLSKSVFGSLLQHTRYGKTTNDTVTLTGDDQAMRSRVTRDLGGMNTTFHERRSLIDPGSLRERPNLPDTEFTVEMDIPAQTFIEAVESIELDYTLLKAVDDTLQFTAESDISDTAIAVDVEWSGESAESLYSTDYLERIANALHSGKVDNITLKFKDEYPMYVEFEREETYQGTIMVAPRVRQE